MANYTIGDMVFDTREARGYSQEELSFGICSTSSLSRIENNSQVPGKRLFDALMQRMGVSASIYSAFVSRREMEIYRLIQELVWRLESQDYTHVNVLIQELESRIGDREVLEKQYLIFAKASMMKRNGGTSEAVLATLLEAIQLTMPDFEERKNIKNRLLTFDEITVLNSIALEYYNMGQQEQGLKLLYELKNYLEEHVIDEEEKAKKYPMILYNIAWRLGGEIGNHWEAYQISNVGIKYCIKHNKLIALPYLINTKACAACEMNKREEAKLLFHQAVTLFDICEKKESATHIRDEIAIKYHLRIDQEPSIKSPKK